MKHFPAIALASILAVSGSPVTAGEQAITLDDYRSGISSHWKEKQFNGRTLYQASRIDGVDCIAATSSGSASGLVYEINYDPHESPLLSWQWRIEDVIAKGDPSKKSGDDYAARVYVVFPSALFWRTKALNYIWDSKLPVGTIIPNAYTANAMMIVTESGPANRRRWITEERDIRADFLKAFGQPPPRVGAIAVMTDTDDTGETAQACYGPIHIRKAAP